MKKHNDEIEIFCPSCNNREFLEFEQSEQEQKLRCSSCGEIIYWHSCPGCGTGFYDKSEVRNCPDCDDKKSALHLLTKRKVWLAKTCPYCGGKIPFFPGFLETKRIYVDCPHCSQHPEITGVARSFILIFLWFVISVWTAERAGIIPWLTALPKILMIILTALVLVTGAVMILYLTLNLKKSD